MTGRISFCLSLNQSRLRFSLNLCSHNSYKHKFHQRYLHHLRYHRLHRLFHSMTGFCIINLLLITKSCRLVLRENAKH